MSRRHVRCVATVAAVCLLVSLFAAALPARAALVDPVVVRVPAKAWAQLPGATVKAGQALDYGSFRWVEMERADLAKLEARGVAYELVTEARQVRVPNYAFDPLLDGEPAVAPAMRADASQPGFRLVQMQGPPKDEWLAALNGGGARTLQYYPHNTYLVWATPAASEAVAQLGFVRWSGAFHPAYKVNADLRGKSGTVRNVDVTFYSDNVKGTVAKLRALGAEVLQFYKSQPDGAFYDAIVALDAGKVDAVAAFPEVLWLGYESPRPTLDDEMSDQIMAGNHPGGTPVLGYNAHLATLGVDGTGVTMAVIDTGVDYDHPDLSSHIVGGSSFPGIPAGCDTGSTPGADCTGGGHGTHVAGIMGGDATGAFTDVNGFLYGLGMAPEIGLFAMNSLSAPAWPPAGGWQEHTKRAVLGGAVGGNNSWTTGEGPNHGYQASERTHDLMVRDGNFDTAALEPFIEMFSAGNSGPSASTITAPHEAKNIIATGSSLNFRAGSINGLSSFSSRGPAVDGRIVPTISSPGDTIASTRNDLGGLCATAIAGTNNLYAFCSGTSMASPHTTGAVALIVDWWRDNHAGQNPSPAMAKALLVNNAVDMGTADIPNNNEGWGRVNVTNVITPPAMANHWDQQTVFGSTGQSFQITLGVPNPGQPVKVTLVWTDAAGAVGANPALVNNLDLTVVDGANTYLGNRFVSGWSATGGSADNRNNVENVFIQTPSTGSIDITIGATAINGDGIPGNGDLTDQDFALVCTNCALNPDFTHAVTPASVAVCAPTSAQYTVNIGNILSFSDPVTLSASANPVPTAVGFGTNPVTPPGTSTMTISNLGSLFGHFDVQVDATSTTGTKSRMVGLDIFQATPSAPALVAPADGAINQPVQPTFDWIPPSEGGSHVIEIATDAAFTNIVVTAAVAPNQFILTSTSLNTNTTYFWRVRSTNACGTGPNSVVRSFTTVPAPGDCGVGATLVPLYSTDFETAPGQAGWTHSGSGDSWALSGVRTHSGVNAYNASSPAAVSDQYLVSPPIALPAGAASVALKFWDHETIEDESATACFDAAVLEISTNGGGSWTRIEAQLLTSPYKGPVSTAWSNPIAGTNAWCGDPRDWTNVIANLTSFAGQTVQLRFRHATDISVSREGWYVDDVSAHACITLIFKDGFEGGNLTLWTGGIAP